MATRLTQEQQDEMERGLLAKKSEVTSASINAGLNLDGALPTSLEVDAEVDGQAYHWELKDDISSVVLMRGIDLDRLLAEVNEKIEQGDPDGALASQTRYDSTLDFIFLAIFKASYPGDNPLSDAALLRRAFDRMDRVRLVMRFFALRMNKPSHVSIGGETLPAEPRPTPIQSVNGQSKAKKMEKALGG